MAPACAARHLDSCCTRWRGGLSRGTDGANECGWPRGGQAAKRGQAGAVPTLASPAVRRVAREHGLDLALMQGTGPDGRILRGTRCASDPVHQRRAVGHDD